MAGGKWYIRRTRGRKVVDMCRGACRELRVFYREFWDNNNGGGDDDDVEHDGPLNPSPPRTRCRLPTCARFVETSPQGAHAHGLSFFFEEVQKTSRVFGGRLAHHTPSHTNPSVSGEGDSSLSRVLSQICALRRRARRGGIPRSGATVTTEKRVPRVSAATPGG